MPLLSHVSVKMRMSGFSVTINALSSGIFPVAFRLWRFMLRIFSGPLSGLVFTPFEILSVWVSLCLDWMSFILVCVIKPTCESESFSVWEFF